MNHSVVSDSLRPRGLQPTRLLCPWDFPGKNTGAGCHFLLQGIFPTQESNPGLLHCRQTQAYVSACVCYIKSMYSLANMSKGALLLPPSDVYVRSFLYLLYFNKTLLYKSSEQSSLISGPRLNYSLLEAKNSGSFHVSATTFQ